MSCERRRRQPTQDGDSTWSTRTRPEEHACRASTSESSRQPWRTLPPNNARPSRWHSAGHDPRTGRASAGLPLGTAKTRIRSGLQILRLQLAPIAASCWAWGWPSSACNTSRRELRSIAGAGIALVTTSELVPLRLVPTRHPPFRPRRTRITVAEKATQSRPECGGAASRHVPGQGAPRRSLDFAGTLDVGKDGKASLIAEDTALSSHRCGGGHLRAGGTPVWLESLASLIERLAIQARFPARLSQPGCPARLSHARLSRQCCPTPGCPAMLSTPGCPRPGCPSPASRTSPPSSPVSRQTNGWP